MIQNVMKNNKNKRNVTSPIYYVNGDPHIGHAYTQIACDVQVRFWRMRGEDVIFCTGTDEHGQKVANAAKSSGITPQEQVNIAHKKFVDLNEELKIDSHRFLRTTSEKHKISAQHLWNELVKNSYIYLGEYKGWYSERDETFFSEKDLVNGKAPTGSPVEFISEQCYFLKLSAFQEKLLNFYENNSNFVLPNTRFNEVKSFVKSGLNDLAISRSHIQWGIKVPSNPEHVMYVWIDALSNYITSLNYPDLREVNEFMPVTDHVIGKDILIFHAVYWPIMLMGAGLPLPKRIISHGWWKNGEEKMSKSLGNVVSIEDLLKVYDLDAIRFFMFREVPFGQDGNISHEAIANRINSDLANNFGNLIHRTMSFCLKNIGNELEFDKNWMNFGANCGVETKMNSDMEFMHWRKNTNEKLVQMMQNYDYHKYLEEVMNASKEANQYIDTSKPWEMKKFPDRENEMKKTIYLLLKRIYDITYYLEPFMPETCEKIFQQLGFSKTFDDSSDCDAYDLGESSELDGSNELSKSCESGRFAMSPPEHIFKKVDL